jgi:hypothetical protein
MATNLLVMDVPPESIAPMRELIGLYRSTFAQKMREHFQLMLAGAYAVYVTALGEGFDPTLRAHLTDVLQDVIARAPELAEIFEGELLRSFQERLEQSSGAARGAAKSGDSQGFDDLPEGDAAVREFVAKTVRGIDTQHGSVILAVTKTFAKLVDQATEGFRPPWGTACLFSAFAAVLKHVDVPIHGRVKLALYKTFAQEVLRHIGDACLLLRDALPDDYSQLAAVPACPWGASVSAGPTLSEVRSGSNPGLSNDGGLDAGLRDFDPELQRFAGKPVAWKAGAGTVMDTIDPVSNSPGVPATPAPAEESQRPRAWGWFAAVLLFLLLGLGLLWGIWRSGVYSAWLDVIPWLDRRQPPLNGGGEPAKPLAEAGGEVPAFSQAPFSTGKQGVSDPALRESAGLEPPHSAAQPDGGPQPEGKLLRLPSSSDPVEKLEALRAVKLEEVIWHADPAGGATVFDWRIDNASPFRISGIEVACSQYGQKRVFLEAAKVVLSESIEPRQSRHYRAVPMGFASGKTERVECVVSDLSVERLAGAEP